MTKVEQNKKNGKLYHSQASSLPKIERLMLFELSVGGHYPEYIAHLIDYWSKLETNKQLYLVLSPLFFQKHSSVISLVKQYNLQNVFCISISPEDFANLKSFNNSIDRNIRAWQELRLIRKYAIELESDRVFLPYFDTRIIPLIFSKKFPCTYSGIYFRPSFHYHLFLKHNLSLKNKIQNWREKIILNLVLRDSNLQTLFCLDPFAIEQIDKINPDKKVVYLPDPVKLHLNPNLSWKQLKFDLEIEPTRKVFLLFGQLSERKGTNKILESISLLPTELCKSLCVLFVGSMTEKYSKKIHDIVSQLTNTLPVQVIIKNQYIPEEDIQIYYQLADVILALYQRHIGMSGILNRAAIAQKPVLATNYGLIGEITRRNKLGIAVDSSQATAIAAGFTKYLTESADKHYDFVSMMQFAQKNTPEKFARTIFEHILN